MNNVSKLAAAAPSPSARGPQMTAFHCRDCGRNQAHLSRKRNAFERFLLPLFLFHPVRCAHCFRRHYVPIFWEISARTHHPDSPQPPNQMAA
jgi:hypothetical protein